MDISGKTAMVVHQVNAKMVAQPGAIAPDAAKSAAREFEAVFLTETVEDMLNSVDIGDFGGGHAEETWRSFLARAYADQLVEQGTTGIAASVENSISAYRAAMRG